ncbi:DUF1816 domain-containing protein [Thermosynechococcaceae cyanobacterium Okahandja]
MVGDNNTTFTGWLANVVNEIGLAWWVKVETKQPHCIYYFGPFLTPAEADKEKDGYIEDLKAEGAEGFDIEVLRCRPQHLTIDEEGTKKPLMPLSSVVT